jgi:DHA1 family multidrug resistance protein-like MFS transporter
MAWHEYMRAANSGRYFRRTIPIIAIGGLFNFFWGLTTPIFSIRINEITGSLVISGFVLGIWGVIKFFTDIPAGVLCDKLGTKKVITVALVAYMFITFMYAIVNDDLSLIILRIIHSVFGSLYWVSYWSALRSVPKKYIQGEVSFSTTIRNISLVVAPLVGSVIIVIYSWQMPFYMLSLSFIIMIFLARKLPNTKQTDRKSIDIISKGIGDFVKKGKKASGIILAIMIYETGLAFMSSFLPILMNGWGYSIEDIGLVLSVSSSAPWIIFPLLLLAFIEKRGETAPIVVGMLTSSLGFWLFLISNTLLSIMLSVFIINTGFSMILVCTDIIIGEIANRGNVGQFSGVTETFKDLSSFLGSFFGGILLQSISMNIFGAYSGFLIVSMPLVYILLR